MFELISKLLATTIGLTMLDSALVGDGFAYSDIVLCGSAIFSDCVSSKSSPNPSACYLILAFRFLRVVLSIFGSTATKPDELLLVINR